MRGIVITRRQTLKGGLALGAVASGAFRGAAVAENLGPSPLTLWYTQPAEQWTEALPIGNGRLGAMIFGGVARERLQLNEDTLYAGGPYDPSNPEALEALPRVRALIAAGNYVDAQNLAQERMMARPIRMPSYQTVGDLILNFGPSAYSQNYRRDLDLDQRMRRREFCPWRRHFHARIVCLGGRSGHRHAPHGRSCGRAHFPCEFRDSDARVGCD